MRNQSGWRRVAVAAVGRPIFEVASWRYPPAFDMLLSGRRLGSNPRVCVTTTPRATLVVKRFGQPPGLVGGLSARGLPLKPATVEAPPDAHSSGAAAQAADGAAASLEKLGMVAEEVVRPLGTIGSPVPPALPALPIRGPGRLMSGEQWGSVASVGGTAIGERTTPRSGRPRTTAWMATRPPRTGGRQPTGRMPHRVAGHGLAAVATGGWIPQGPRA